MVGDEGWEVDRDKITEGISGGDFRCSSKCGAKLLEGFKAEGSHEVVFFVKYHCGKEINETGSRETIRRRHPGEGRWWLGPV